jgi:hypothetical protein
MVFDIKRNIYLSWKYKSDFDKNSGMKKSNIRQLVVMNAEAIVCTATANNKQLVQVEKVEVKLCMRLL